MCVRMAKGGVGCCVGKAFNAVSCICLLEKLGVNEAVIILHVVKI